MFSGASAFIQFVPKIGELLKQALDHYAFLRASGLEATPDLVAEFLVAKMASWNPQVYGREVLDEQTKMAGARFLAGIAFNLGGADAKELRI